MATTKTAASSKTMNIYEKLANARIDFLKANVQKTGVNPSSEYDYFELADIVPVATPILLKYRLLLIITFPEGIPTGTLYDMDSEQSIVFNSNRLEGEILSIKGNKIMLAIQSEGAKETYYRRYIWMQVLDITEHDEIENISDKKKNSETPKEKSKSAKIPIAETERESIKKELTDSEGQADELQINQLKQALKALNDLDDNYESFIQKIVTRTDNFTNLTKKACTECILKVGELIDETKAGVKE